jgi:hypothetical protein
LKNSILLFFISPFLGVIQAFKHFKESWAKNSILFFVVFFGFTMVKPEQMDSFRYILKLKELYMASMNWETFVANFSSEDSDSFDVYQPFVTYLVALFTDNGNILFAIFGIVFGYFYSRNIWLLLEYSEKKEMNRTLWLLVFSFACIVGFWQLNGVRMWTASHIFFYGVFLFFIKGEKKGFLIAISSVLVHFSFVLPVLFFLVSIVIKIPRKLLFILFISSFFISELNISALSGTLQGLLPSFLLPKVNSYLNEDYVESVSEVAEITSWFVVYMNKSIGWAISILLSIIHFSANDTFKSNKFFSNFFSFTILFLTIGNIMTLVPSGSRYLIIAQLFALAVIIMYYSDYIFDLYSKWLVYLTPIFIFFIIVSIRVALDSTSVMTVFANPIVVSFIDLPIPLLSIFK